MCHSVELYACQRRKRRFSGSVTGGGFDAQYIWKRGHGAAQITILTPNLTPNLASSLQIYCSCSVHSFWITSCVAWMSSHNRCGIEWETDLFMWLFYTLKKEKKKHFQMVFKHLLKLCSGQMLIWEHFQQPWKAQQDVVTVYWAGWRLDNLQKIVLEIKERDGFWLLCLTKWNRSFYLSEIKETLLCRWNKTVHFQHHVAQIWTFTETTSSTTAEFTWLSPWKSHAVKVCLLHLVSFGWQCVTAGVSVHAPSSVNRHLKCPFGVYVSPISVQVTFSPVKYLHNNLEIMTTPHVSVFISSSKSKNLSEKVCAIEIFSINPK